jgi:hypothetical protein
LTLDLGETEAEVDSAWETARGKMTRTVFAQQRLRPDEVLPEWRKAVAVLGGEDDVARFVGVAADRLGTPLEAYRDYYRLPLGHLPKELQERLEGIGLKGTLKIAFRQPVPSGVLHIHRAHPLVAALADYVAETSLDLGDPNLGARAGAMFTSGVDVRTTIYLLRLRHQIAVERRDPLGGYTLSKSLLAEECIGVAVRGTTVPKVLNEADALALLSLEPGRNMEDGQKIRLIAQALESVPQLEPRFNELAERRAEELLADHRRIREASDTRGIRYSVSPALPVDKIGIYVLMPMAKL